MNGVIKSRIMGMSHRHHRSLPFPYHPILKMIIQFIRPIVTLVMTAPMISNGSIASYERRHRRILVRFHRPHNNCISVVLIMPPNQHHDHHHRRWHRHQLRPWNERLLESTTIIIAIPSWTTRLTNKRRRRRRRRRECVFKILTKTRTYSNVYVQKFRTRERERVQNTYLPCLERIVIQIFDTK